MGLFFEGVSVGDGEGDETRGAAFDAELEASEMTEEADEEGARIKIKALNSFPNLRFRVRNWCYPSHL